LTSAVGDVLLSSKLNGGESVLFSVPLKALKGGGEVEVPFHRESGSRPESARFPASQLPRGILR
jgi:hypothetical protein